MSKRKFIFSLDNDDMFFSNDIFYYILKIAGESDFDIVGLRGFKKSDYENNTEKILDLFDYEDYLKNITFHQPQISTWMITIKRIYQPHDIIIRS